MSTFDVTFVSDHDNGTPAKVAYGHGWVDGYAFSVTDRGFVFRPFPENVQPGKVAAESYVSRTYDDTYELL